MKHIDVAITIQARMTSSRLPGKVMLPALGKPMLSLMVERLRRVGEGLPIILCTTSKETDDVLEDLAGEMDILCYRGSEDDVMSRVLEAAQFFNVQHIVETTGDCPLIDPEVMDKLIQYYFDNALDYASNNYKRSYPMGMDTQIYATSVLADAYERCTSDEEREHVSLFIYRHPEIYRLGWIEAPPEFYDPYLRLTLDTQEDLKLIRKIFESLYPQNPEFTLLDVLTLLREYPSWREINSEVQHNWVSY